MASILDDLKGILTPEEFAKVQGRQDLATRLTRGDELRSYFDGEEATPPASVTPPPSSTSAAPSWGGSTSTPTGTPVAARRSPALWWSS